MWIRRKVKPGFKLGKKLGHPTINFSVGSFGQHFSAGVYTCKVRINGKTYKGALFFGPKLNEPGKVLEIFVLDFSDHLYGRFVSFKVGRKIRKPIKFTSLAELKKQIQKDIASVV